VSSSVRAGNTDAAVRRNDVNGTANLFHSLAPRSRYVASAGLTVKSVCFWGDRSSLVVSGCDSGRLWVYDARSGGVLTSFVADAEGAVNCLSPHPFAPLLLTSGLSHDAKVWTTGGGADSFDEARAAAAALRHEEARSHLYDWVRNGTEMPASEAEEDLEGAGLDEDGSGSSGDSSGSSSSSSHDRNDNDADDVGEAAVEVADAAVATPRQHRNDDDADAAVAAEEDDDDDADDAGDDDDDDDDGGDDDEGIFDSETDAEDDDSHPVRLLATDRGVPGSP